MTGVLPGPKVLVIGPPGTGKTWSLRTLVDAGVTPFIIFTEQSQMILNTLPADKCHWHYISPANYGWDAMIKFAEKINTLSVKTLIETRDPGMANYKQFIELLSVLSKFKCDRTGEVFGPVDDFGPGRCLVIDNLSGINLMASHLVTGGRYARTTPEWGIMQGEEEKIINAWINLMCSLVLIAHPTLERDEVTGRSRIYANALGNKLAPKLGGKFDEIMVSKREGKEFYWDNISDSADTKFRLLPPRQNLPQDYRPLFHAWQEAGGKLTQTKEN